MCFITTNPEREIAKEDITVYKQMFFRDSSLWSMYHISGVNYHIGEVYETEIKECEDSCPHDTFALLWCKDNMKAGNTLYHFGQGFHSFGKGLRVEEYPEEGVLVKGVIPKGAEYMVQADSGGCLYISNKIRYDSIVE